MQWGPATKNYVTITVAGTNVQASLASLKKRVSKAGKAVSAQKLHFSVCHTEGSWSAEDIKRLAAKVKEILQHQSATNNNTFICDEDAFFNHKGDRIQGMLHPLVSDPLFASF